MVKRVDTWRFRKSTDVERRYAYYEMLHGEAVLMEIGATDAGEIEVLFEREAPGHLFSMVNFAQALAEAQELMKEEIAGST